MMSTKITHVFVGSVVPALVASFLAGAAVAETAPRLRFGFQKNHSYSYEIKIEAELPDEEVTHSGVLTYGVPSASSEQFVLKCHGMLIKSSKPTPGSQPSMPFGPGGFGGPRIPAPPGFGGPRGFGGPMGFGGPRFGGPFGPRSEPAQPDGTTFSRQGEIVVFGTTESLPLLLGNQVDFVIEALPNQPKTKWEKETDLGVIERDESGPFVHPFGPQRTSETKRGAAEQIDYAVLETNPDTVRISKKYSLKTVPEEGQKNQIEMSGSGEFEFDRKEGVVRSQTMKYDIQFKEKNINVTIPISLTYRLLSDAEIAERRKKAESARAALPNPEDLDLPSHEEIKKLAEEMNSGDPERAKAARERMMQMVHEKQAAKPEAPVRPARPAKPTKRETTAKAKEISPKPKMRKWHDVTDTYELEATLVKSEGDKVTIKRADGKTITLPIAKLSKADQEYVLQQAKTLEKDAENPFE